MIRLRICRLLAALVLTLTAARLCAADTGLLRTVQDSNALLGGEYMGVAYSGFRRGQHPDRGDGAVMPGREDILEDLAILEQQGFRLLRLYDSGENSRQVLELIHEKGLPFKVLLGAWLKAEISNHEGCDWLDEPIPEATLAENSNANDEEVRRTIALAKDHADTVVAVNVGNEMLVEWNDHMVSVGRVQALLTRVRDAVEQPVSIAENYLWWATNGEQLAGYVDFVGVHSYAIWEEQTIGNALAFTVHNVNAVRRAMPGLPIAILEAGWPTTSRDFPNQASANNQARYFSELLSWSQSNNTTVMFFEAFDESWKGEEGVTDETEKHWGLYYEDRRPKAAMLPGRWHDPDAVVWAVNVGSDEAAGIAGVNFEAGMLKSGRARSIDAVKAVQYPQVFSTLREGEITLSRALRNGTYNVTLLFAEPDNIAAGERLFNIRMEDELVMGRVDVRRYRDDNLRSGWRHSVANVQVLDGRLDIALEATTGMPILSGVVVRRQQRDPRQWELLWSDEFRGTGAPDPGLWNIEEWEAGRVNSEDQAYTSRRRNVRLEDGLLVIEAHRENHDNAKYTSGRVQTRGKGTLLYGRVDVRARLPRGQGTWSAIWMMPDDLYRYATTCGPGAPVHGSAACDAWPNSGEIDIAEHVGYNPTHVHGTVHTRSYFFINQEQRKGSIEAPNVSDDFHLYSLEWSPGALHVYYDGVRYFSYYNDGSGWESWPFDHPYHLILNLAVGGDWGRAGGPIDPGIFPARMEVDYVRVFKPVSND